MYTVNMKTWEHGSTGAKAPVSLKDGSQFGSSVVQINKIVSVFIPPFLDHAII